MTRNTRTIRERLAAHGFALESTGGNCTRYVRRDSNGVTESIVHVDGWHHPTGARDRVTLYTDPDEEAGILGEAMSGYTLAHCLAALEHPSQEYYLLSLRLHNLTTRGQHV